MYSGSDAQESVRLIIAIQSAYDAKHDQNLASALEETCTLICVGGESFVRSLDTHSYIALLIELLGHKNPQIAVLSMRAIALIADTVPKACNVLVSSDSIPVLLQWAKKKQYLASNSNFTEELLKCLEILSLEAHKPMLKHSAVSLLVGLTAVLKEKLRFSALCCVSNLISACRPQDLGLVEVSIPHLNGLLMEQLSSDSVRFRDTALTARVCVCFAHILDRVTVNERLMDRFLGGEGRSLVPNMVSVLQYANQSQEPLLLRRSAIGVLSAMFSSSPSVAIREFIHHHALQGVCSTMLDLVTANEDRLQFDSMGGGEASGRVPQDGNPARQQAGASVNRGVDEKSKIGDSLPLLSQEQGCVLLLDFLLYIIPRAQGGMDEYNMTLPHHGWQWEDDFHNHNEYDDEQAKKLEEEYQRQQISKRFRPFEILQGARAVAVDFEHLRFLNSHGGLSRPFFRFPIPSYFFHRRAHILQERCKCFGLDTDQGSIVSDRGSLADDGLEEEAENDSDSQSSYFAKFKGCMCGGSEDDSVPRPDDGDDTPIFSDLREEKLLNSTTRSAFNQPETMRLVLSTLVPSLLSLVFSVVNPVVVRHTSILLLRCLSLTRDFVRKHAADFGPKAREVLVLEAPTITQALVMMLNAASVDIGPRMALTSVVQVRLDRNTELGALLQAGPTLTSSLSTQGEILLSSLESCTLLSDLLGEKAIQLLSTQGAAIRLKNIGVSLQHTLDTLSEEDNRLLGGSRTTASYSNASYTSFPNRGVAGNQSSFVQVITSRADNVDGSVQESNSTPAPTCPLHVPRSRWVSDALALQQPLLKHVNGVQVRPPEVSLKSDVNPLLAIPSLVSTPHSHHGPGSLTSVQMASVSSNLSDSGEFSAVAPETISTPDVEELDCWEVLVKVNSALANDELSLEAVYTRDPRAIAVLARKLREDWDLHFSSMSQLKQEVHSSTTSPSLSVTATWIPHASLASAHNLAHSLAQRVGRYVDLAGTHAPDNIHSVLHRPGRATTHSGRGVVVSTPFALQMMEDRLIRPLSMRVSSYELPGNLDSSFSGSSRSLKASSSILIDGKQLPIVALQKDFEDNLLCLPFASITSLENEILRRVYQYLELPGSRLPAATQWSSTTGGQTSRIEGSEEPTKEQIKNLHVIVFLNGIPLRSPSMTLLDALCTYSASALSLRRLLEAPLSHHRQSLSKALSIWLSQHPIQFAVVSEAPPLEPRHLAQLGCSCEYRKPYYCTPMHHYTLAKEKNSDHVLTHSLEILHLLLPAIRKPGQLVPGAMRKMYSSVIHDLHTQSSTFLVPSLAPLCHMVTQTGRLEATLATYALWNYPQVFPLSLRVAVFTLTLSTGSVLAARALNSTVLLQRNQIVGAEWSAHSQSVSQQLMNFPHMQSPFMMAPGAAPKKLKLAIDREKILDEAAHIFEVYASCPAPYDIEFKGEPGSGLGPTLEFFSLVGAGLAQAPGLWLKRSDGLLVPSYPLPLEQLVLLELLGALIGRCLKEKRQVDIRLHPVFWATILGTSVSREVGSAQSTFLDADVEKSLIQIKNLSDDALLSADLRWTVPGTELPLLPGGEATFVTCENRNSYVQAVKAHYAKNRLTQPAEAVSRGIQRVFSPCHLRLFSTEEMAYLLSGPRGRLWNSPQEVANDVICAHGYTINSKPVRYLIETVGEWNEIQQRKFLLFISGSECIPIGGLQPKITVVRKDVELSPQQNASLSPPSSHLSRPGSQQSLASQSTPERSSVSQQTQQDFSSPISELKLVDLTLPTVNTCFHYLKLPEYTSLDHLQKQLTYAVNEGQDSFGLS